MLLFPLTCKLQGIEYILWYYLFVHFDQFVQEKSHVKLYLPRSIEIWELGNITIYFKPSRFFAKSVIFSIILISVKLICDFLCVIYEHKYIINGLYFLISNYQVQVNYPLQSLVYNTNRVSSIRDIIYSNLAKYARLDTVGHTFYNYFKERLCLH